MSRCVVYQNDFFRSDDLHTYMGMFASIYLYASNVGKAIIKLNP
jgi:hypothetical protein